MRARLPEKSTRYWPRRYTLIGLCFCASFICYLDRINISVASITMASELGWSETTKGFVLSSFYIGYLFVQIPGGWLANRIGGKIVLGCAVLWWSLFTFFTPIAASWSLTILLAVRIAMGLGEGLAFPAIFNLYGRWVPGNEKSRAVSFTFSGMSLGTLAALTGTAWFVESFGWQSVFFLSGAIGFVWVVIWILRTANTPDQHPTISAVELEHITRTAALSKRPESVPWRALLTSMPIWAIIINHFCVNWGFYILLAWLPSYFTNALGVSLKVAGFYAAAPMLTLFVMSNVSGWIADGLLKRGYSTIFVRKLMQHISLLGPALFLLLLHDVSSPLQATVYLCCALGLSSFCFSGFFANEFDVAPRHADVLLGIANTAGTIPGIIGVAVTGWLIEETGSYDFTFRLAAGIYIFGAIIWQLFAKGEIIVD